MVTVSEVVVRAVPEGISETTDGLEEVESATKETTDQMGEQSEEMSSFAQSFQGSMGAILAGLGVATAGLLSQVPVIGEAFSGLTAVVDAVALRLDSVLRPVFGPITNKLMNLADTIYEADGAFGAILDGVIVLATALGTLAGVIATATALSSVFAGTFATLATIGSVVVTALTAVAGALSLPLIAIAAVVAGVLLLVNHFIGLRNIWNGIISRFKSGIETLNALVTIFKTLLPAAVTAMKEGIQSKINGVITTVTTFVNGIETKFNELVEQARDWGRSLMQRFIDGLKSLVPTLSDIDLPGGMSVGGVFDMAQSGVASATGGGSEDSGGFIGSVGGTASKIFLDGQRVDNQTGRYRKDSLTRRGG